ncbi:GntR family transcriptional regulator YhfZ [Pullulanibacillus camelliae]|nr:GntR family transcriptional regulator YhfZ [Pullulanibacillus camelliae]
MTRTWESLYSKNGLAAKNIAEDLLSVENGGRIPRVSDFCDKFSLGRGTVQGALRLLELMNAIELESRGHLGTFLKSKDVSVLLEIAGIGPLVGVMPLPYSKKYEGLATGIVDVFDNLNKRVSLAYMRGSRTRVEALKARRYDFAILSLMAAKEAIANNKGLEIIKTFGPGTYVTEHKVFFSDSSKRRIEAGMRVGIDRSSSDQANITLNECQGIAVDFVDTNYMQLFDMLKQGDLDAAVWNIDEVRSVQTFQTGEFQSVEARTLAKQASEATIIVDGMRHEVKEQMTLLDVESVCRTQLSVEKGERFPRY